MQHAKKLKDYRTPSNHKVFISPDLTKKQMEGDRKLQDELYARRNRNEDVIIHRGRIVNRNTNQASENRANTDNVE